MTDWISITTEAGELFKFNPNHIAFVRDDGESIFVYMSGTVPSETNAGALQFIGGDRDSLLRQLRLHYRLKEESQDGS